MKKQLLGSLVIFILLLNCTQKQKSEQQNLEALFSQIYSPEKEGLTSLSFQLDGEHELLKNFEKHIPVDSPQIYIYWKEPFHMKTIIKSQSGTPVEIPRWLDFGFAFGILYGPDLHPILQTPEAELLYLKREFNLDNTATIEHESNADGEKFILKSNDDFKAMQEIQTNAENIILYRKGSRLLRTGSSSVEIGYSENWLKLPNGKTVVSHRQKSYNDKSRLQIIDGIQYNNFDGFWLPNKIEENRNSTEKGRVYKMDMKLVFKNWQLNPEIDDSFFDFPEPEKLVLDFSSPKTTLDGFIKSIKNGNLKNIRSCFSKEMATQFDMLTNEIYQQIAPFPLIPDTTLVKVQSNVLFSLFSRIADPLKSWEINIIKCGQSFAEGTLISNAKMELYRGSYQIILEDNHWKIDTNPYLIFPEN